MVFATTSSQPKQKGIFKMKSSQIVSVRSTSFDETNLIGHAGVIPVMRLAADAGLAGLAQDRLTVPTDKGSHAGAKVMALVAGMVMGADSIDDMNLLRAGAMGKLIGFTYAPSTLGSFLRKFTFGHVRQLDAVASRLLGALSDQTGLLGAPGDTGTVMVDIDDTIIEVHGYAKQGAGFGYSGVRGINALITTISGEQFAPVIAGTRLRRGPAGSPRGAHKLMADTLATVGRTHLTGRPILVRADSAFYSATMVDAALRAGADVSITVRQTRNIKKAIATIPPDAWTPIKYPRAIWDEEAHTWISDAAVAEIPFTAFTSAKKALHVPGRLIVRRIPEANPKASDGQDTLFTLFRYHAFFTTQNPIRVDTVQADQTHRRHAIIENVHADLKASALAHMPSGIFAANAAWLVTTAIAFNLTRAAATLTGHPQLARATTPTIRRTLITIPARIATSARKLAMHLPARWPHQHAWQTLWTKTHTPEPATAVT
jgi:hypothetical protein